MEKHWSREKLSNLSLKKASGERCKEKFIPLSPVLQIFGTSFDMKNITGNNSMGDKWPADSQHHRPMNIKHHLLSPIPGVSIYYRTKRLNAARLDSFSQWLSQPREELAVTSNPLLRKVAAPALPGLFCRILHLRAPRGSLLPNKFHGNVVTSDTGTMILDFHRQ